jgi:prepilin-type N-terminal cleavage/methylation domain-containing protein/prepilin-type processing-associated H-X9-DG protein
MTQRRGFTLIELLVVIAIIGILAAMLFPVFARARESARKTQCLANVKNVAIAVQMYLTDYDAFPPKEHGQGVLEYAAQVPGGGAPDDPPTDCYLTERGNPYLRWPVILDDYTKNRDIWRCPSAQMTHGATFIYPTPEWLQFLKANEGEWGDASYNLSPCREGWPTGWGGDITDTIHQGALATTETTAAKSRAFVQGIGIGEVPLAEMKTSSFGDASGLVVCSDGGAHVNQNLASTVAYPDVCMLACSVPECSWVDWENCSDGLACGELLWYAPNNGSYLKDVKLRKKFSRHLGGINIGFGDGHAKWFDSESFLAAVKANLMGQPSSISGGLDTNEPNTLCGGPLGSATELAPGVPFLY